MVPKFGGGFSEEELLSSIEESKASATQASSRPSQMPQEEKLPIRLNAYLGMLAAGDVGGMSGSSSLTSSGGGNLAVATSAKAVSLQDNALVVWLSRSDWLAIPMSPGGSLLRPPQVL